ncbi:MAG TPA: alanine racemase [Alphaproteobacteria bacterium]|nr:alanine racemase [Alphaproteobacteria bacterium]
MEINNLSISLKKKSQKYLAQYGTVIFINKNNIIHNSNIISDKCINKIISPVIKSDAYGIGAKQLTKILIECGYKSFFLGNLAEGSEIRKKFQNIDLFIMNCGYPFNIKYLKKYKLIPVINNLENLKSWSKYSTKRDYCIIHVDTGMNRLGINLKDIKNSLNNKYFNKINIKFIMSHLACAEDTNNLMNNKQLNELKDCTKLLSIITKKEIKASICNSSGIWLGKKYLLNIVRPGAAFLGINPILNKNNPLKETISLYAQISQIREVSKNDTIGYGRTLTIKKENRIATISIGYSNGLSRFLSNIGDVYIKKKKLKILGRVSMDLTVIDISVFKDGEIKNGDIVEIFGPNRTLENFAKINKTIPYEILCTMTKTIPKLIT